MKGSIHAVVAVLTREIKRWKVPAVGVVASETRDPFQVLVSTVLSLRTQDRTTEEASRRLFRVARTPRALAGLDTRRLEKLIYPVCFYRNKARSLKEMCRTLLSGYGGRVPDDIDELLKLKGVGRKTANLVVTLGFDKPGICVDTHVHRIMNRLGYVRTKAPDETEEILRRKLPRPYWNIINDLLVTFGQNLCRPVSPWCSRCAIFRHCPKVGVSTSR
ncbi:MAG: endonuclease III [Elusimicrobia bacterium]|nr:endonuclease III [Elusimicrobiota bacterium]